MSPEEQANAAAIGAGRPGVEAVRRLSWWRILAVVTVLLAASGSLAAFRPGSHRAPAAQPSESFAPYVDVTATPTFAFEDPTVLTANNVVLGFVVSSPGSAPDAGCTPSWGGAYSLGGAAGDLDLDRRIARVQQRGGGVSVSFGGAANSELAVSCPDVTQLGAAYLAVVQRYALSSIDLDIETDPASAADVDARRAAALATVQAARAKAGHPLAIWLTLPIGASGITTAGRAVLDALLDARVALAGVNALTMDYAQGSADAATMSEIGELALSSLSRQLIDAYRSVGVALTADAAWHQIGATAMIGQNDVLDERFELTDAQALVAFAKLHQLARLSMWSANRDQECGINYANPEVVSDDCSGVSEQPAAFGAVFESFDTRAMAGRVSTRHVATSGSRTAMAASPSAGSATTRRPRRTRSRTSRAPTPRAPRSSGTTTCTSPSGGPRATFPTRRSATRTTPRGRCSDRSCPASTRRRFRPCRRAVIPAGTPTRSTRTATGSGTTTSATRPSGGTRARCPHPIRCNRPTPPGP